MSGYTPAPWRLHRYPGRPTPMVVNGGGYVIVSDIYRPEGCPQEEATANAHLVAAAPDMADEIRFALSRLHAYAAPEVLLEDLPLVLDRLRKVLAEAEGRGA